MGIRKAQAIKPNASVKNLEFGYSAFIPERAPCAVKRPEKASLIQGRKPDFSFGHVEGEAGIRQKQRVARHAPCVIASALHLVPRIALFAVIPVANALYNGKAFIYQAAADHMRRRLIFKPVHALFAVGNRNNRLSDIFRPAADGEPRLVVQAVNAAGIEMEA